MFEKARIKLTAWYVLIIMIVSIAFSSIIYFGAAREFDRVLRMQRYRISHPTVRLELLPNGGVRQQIIQEETPDVDVISDARLRVLSSLFGVNIVILFISTLLGYFLAGRTLSPIKKMVDDQSRFITDASHELHTPLTSLRTSLEVNLRDKKLSLSQAKAALESNLEDVIQLQSLSQDLLELARYQMLSPASFFTNVSLPTIGNEAVGKVRPLAKVKNIRIITDIADAMVYGDEKALREVLVILLDNAIKYSEVKKTVTLTSKAMDGHVIVTVADQGYGIAKEDLPHVFDRFYRGDKSRSKQETTGFGLGLSIAKRVVEMHKGTIQVESIVGVGSTFIVSLPKKAKS